MRLRCAPASTSLGRGARRPQFGRCFPRQQLQVPNNRQTDDILPRPTWSLQDLFAKKHQFLASRKYAFSSNRKYFGHPPDAIPTVSPKELHHLLRLSALPAPKDLAEEEMMLKDLQSQLRFVKAVQKIRIPIHVQPLQSIRDETEEGMREQEYTIESLAEEFAKEEVVGIRGRIRTKRAQNGENTAKRNEAKDKGEQLKKEKAKEKWDPLALAPRTVGRYIAVNTATD
ncbi:MAG: hypothetical protein Q9170_004370 [Blastenia crenularia]